MHIFPFPAYFIHCYTVSFNIILTTDESGICIICGSVDDTSGEVGYTQGLEYTAAYDEELGVYYSVSGIGSAYGNKIVIPATYHGLNVLACPTPALSPPPRRSGT